MCKILVVLILVLPVNAKPQEPTRSSTSAYHRWHSAVVATLSKQPGWSSALISTTVGLGQLGRLDAVRREGAHDAGSWELASKIYVLIPQANLEVDLAVPSYFINDSLSSPNGIGGTTFSAKYRVVSANERNGNYIFSVWMNGTIPTGRYRNGSTDASISLNAGGGKGFGSFDVQSMIGVLSPIQSSGILTNGRTLTWNSVAQIRVLRIITPEIENNATFFLGGAHAGAVQNFVTPGVAIGKLRICPSKENSRLAVITGIGVQFASTSYRSYNRAIVTTFRVAF